MPSIDDVYIAVALGANRPSAAGSPRATLLAVRPLLEELLAGWAAQDLRFCWSQLLETKPIGPIEQPDFVNAVVLVKGPPRPQIEERQKDNPRVRQVPS